MRKRLFRMAIVVAATAACMLVGRPAGAILRGRFRSLDEMAAAENLLIVRVPAGHCEPILGMDGVRDYQVEVLLVLRGPTMEQLPHRSQVIADPPPRDGEARRVVVSTTTELNRGKRYLLAGKRASRDGKPWLLFHFDPGIVEIPDDFRLSALQGSSIKQKVAAILLARRAAVQREIQALRKEKELLEGLVPGNVSEAKPEGS